MIRKAVIPAAGFGTRLLPATKSQPKEMLPVVDRPVIQYVVEEAVEAGIKDILMIIGKGKRAIEEHFDRNFDLERELEEKGKLKELEAIKRISELADIHFVWQKELKGLGHAIWCARHHIGNEPFLVLLGDTLLETECDGVSSQLIQIFDKYGKSVIAVEEVERENVSRYGVIRGREIGEGLYTVEYLVEKPTVEEAPSNLAIAGRYVLTPEIFRCIENTSTGKNDEIQLTDAISLLLKQQEILAYRFSGKRHDIGNRFDFIKANIVYALRREDMKDHMLEFLYKIVKEKYSDEV